MNEIKSLELTLKSFMDDDKPNGTGSNYGELVRSRIISEVEQYPEVDVFYISLAGIQLFNASFAREAVVETVKHYRGKKGFCLINFESEDDVDDFISGSVRLQQPVMVRLNGKVEILGPTHPSGPSKGNQDILEYVVSHSKATATNISRDLGLKINNASTKLKQLLEQGFLLRKQKVAETGGVEYIYYPIG